MANGVLVLNQNYEPLNVCSWRRAMILVSLEKAEVLEYSDQSIKTSRQEYLSPSVILLHRLVKRPRIGVKLTRREIFVRDNYTCQYCGQHSRDLTVDHVMPKHRGGRHSWTNLVSACKTCNHRKGGRTPEEARMRLLAPVKTPHTPAYYSIYQRTGGKVDPVWFMYVPGLRELLEDKVAVA